MTLGEYIGKELKRRNKGVEKSDRVFKTELLKELSRKSKVSLLTLQNVERGGKISTYSKAKAVSDATEGKVSVEELCE